MFIFRCTVLFVTRFLLTQFLKIYLKPISNLIKQYKLNIYYIVLRDQNSKFFKFGLRKPSFDAHNKNSR